MCESPTWRIDRRVPLLGDQRVHCSAFSIVLLGQLSARESMKLSDQSFWALALGASPRPAMSVSMRVRSGVSREWCPDSRMADSVAHRVCWANLLILLAGGVCRCALATLGVRLVGLHEGAVEELAHVARPPGGKVHVVARGHGRRCIHP